MISLGPDVIVARSFYSYIYVAIRTLLLLGTDVKSHKLLTALSASKINLS